MSAGAIIRPSAPGPWWKRVAWFVGLWAASVAALGVVGLLIRTALRL
ncbi:DUF2474 domain-containing protein [uncultured Alsobacter sp.]|nr:DUF2474 domain-containing protein [uncultured Alsobacter sp.]